MSCPNEAVLVVVVVLVLLELLVLIASVVVPWVPSEDSVVFDGVVDEAHVLVSARLVDTVIDEVDVDVFIVALVDVVPDVQ
eukprot:820520-Amphidinium_carterae.2